MVRGASALSVVTSEGERHEATLVGYDEYGDVALLDVEAAGLEALPVDFTDTPEPGDALLGYRQLEGRIQRAARGPGGGA